MVLFSATDSSELWAADGSAEIAGKWVLAMRRNPRMVVPTRFLKMAFIVAISVVSDWVVGILNGQFDHNMVSVV